MAFRRVKREISTPESPIELFSDLRPRKIEALYDQQAQLLRDYREKAAETPDVAIQGATGSGKTLVGLLISEWRRRKGERPIYLCPTRQLVHQVANFAKGQLGLPAFAFVGAASKYPQAERTNWRRGEKIAVTTYSALFNIKPFFSDPHFILIDDAHAADQYIGEHWSIRVSRYEESEKPIFDVISSLLSSALPSDELTRLQEEPRSPADLQWVQLVPGPIFWKLEDEITAAIDSCEKGKDLFFRWQTIRGNLRSCQMYVSASEIFIRPILPPTNAHLPFSGANQRLFMSATLGRGGELERLAGVKSILRLPAPAGWSGHGVGRRFFVFPKASLEQDQADAALVRIIRLKNRALVLAADDKAALHFRHTFAERLPEYEVFSAKEIEESKTPFLHAPKSIAVIANRYDGIDFPQDECRILVIDSKPRGANLQERFISEKLGGYALYNERVRSRMIQAFGRCTRSPTDYAILVITGENLMDELLKKDLLRFLDRDLQAEIVFGEEQSTTQNLDGFVENAKEFLEQAEEWRSVEEDIIQLRDNSQEVLPEALEELDKAAEHEVDYAQKMWKSEFALALDSAERVLQEVSGGEALKAYRAMWHYLAGCAAHLSKDSLFAVDQGKAHEHFLLARSLGSVRWLARLEIGSPEDGRVIEDDIADTQAIENIESEICELGLTQRRKYIKREGGIRNGLSKTSAKIFEDSHLELGRLLGFEAKNSDEYGAPDPWWIAGDRLCFVFEDNSDGNERGLLKLEKIRQAASHADWIRENEKSLSKEATIISILISPCSIEDENLRSHLRKVVFWPMEDFRKWANRALDVLGTIRIDLHRPGDLDWRAQALKRLADVNATPSTLRKMILEKMDHYQSP